MLGMKISPLAVLLCALPLAAQAPDRTPTSATDPQQSTLQAPAEAGPRRVLAPCQLVEASLGPSGEDSPTQGRGFGINVRNNSLQTLDFPAYPEFGWRVETQHKHGWKLKAEGGPVRLVGSPTDPHVAVVGPTGSGAMVHVQPTFGRDYRFFLPGASQALHHEGKLTTFKLTVFWAASSAMKQSDPSAPNCAITADWTVSIRPLDR